MTIIDATNLVTKIATCSRHADFLSDLVFVLDCTGSMQRYINATRDHVVGICDMIRGEEGLGGQDDLRVAVSRFAFVQPVPLITFETYCGIELTFRWSIIGIIPLKNIHTSTRLTRFHRIYRLYSNTSKV